MNTRKIVLKVEIDTTDFELTKESLWELNFKIDDWCSKKGFIKKCKIMKFEKKKQKRIAFGQSKTKKMEKSSCYDNPTL